MIKMAILGNEKDYGSILFFAFCYIIMCVLSRKEGCSAFSKSFVWSSQLE